MRVCDYNSTGAGVDVHSTGSRDLWGLGGGPKRVIKYSRYIVYTIQICTHNCTPYTCTCNYSECMTGATI